MKHFEKQLVSYGFIVRVSEGGIVDLIGESKVNRELFNQVVSRHHLAESFSSDLTMFQLCEIEDLEKAFKEAFNWPFRGNHEGLYRFDSEETVLLEHLDFSIAGLVRQLNRLGLSTTMSCEGRPGQAAFIDFLTEDIADQALALLDATGIQVKKSKRRPRKVNLFSKDQDALLDGAIQLSQLAPWETADAKEILLQKRLEKRLREVLAIPGVSGHEERIRSYVMNELRKLTPYVTVDHYGNVLATIQSGSLSSGPVILLNAHLDTARELLASRSVIETNHIWTSSEGILGADDRAGIAIILEALNRIKQNIHYRGTIKVIFTVEEEIGLCGASAVNPSFLWDVDAAIVIDRRGTSDIVTGNSWGDSFCHVAYGQWIEDVAHGQGLLDWACVPGGSSDTRIWAEHGIQSVNLSAGYQHEHTSQESLDVLAAGDTLKLVTQLIQEQRSLRSVLNAIRRDTRIKPAN